MKEHAELINKQTQTLLELSEKEYKIAILSIFKEIKDKVENIYKNKL